MPLRIGFDPSMPPALKDRVALWCEREWKDEVEIVDYDPDRTRVVDPATVVAIASFVISAIALVIQADQAKREKKASEHWGADRLKSVTDEVLLRHGIINSRIEDVRGFDNLDLEGGVCHVEVVDKRSNDRYWIRIQNDGGTHILRLEDIDE